jgi:hypothetical protein
MLLENIIKKHLLLLEKDNYLSKLKNNITVDFRLFKRDHVTDRQFRHKYEITGPCAGEVVSDFDIVSLIDDSLMYVAEEIVNHNIRHNREFIISREGGDYLNLVIIPQNTGKLEWRLVVKTLMCKKNFAIGRDQLQIFIP